MIRKPLSSTRGNKFNKNKMQAFAIALEELKDSCTAYESGLKKTAASNADLKITIDRMIRALDHMKRIFTTSEKCGVCFNRKPDHALECGHTLCQLCASKSLRVEKCPFCRKPISEMMRIYIT